MCMCFFYNQVTSKRAYIFQATVHTAFIRTYHNTHDHSKKKKESMCIMNSICRLTYKSYFSVENMYTHRRPWGFGCSVLTEMQMPSLPSLSRAWEVTRGTQKSVLASMTSLLGDNKMQEQAEMKLQLLRLHEPAVMSAGYCSICIVVVFSKKGQKKRS